MKLVLFERAGDPAAAPGVLTDRGVVSIAETIGPAVSAQAAMQFLIDNFAALRPALERALTETEALPLDGVRLKAPLPRPGKILCSTGGYTARATELAPLLMTLKSAESVIGPGETIRLPQVSSDWQFLPEAELGLVMRGPAKGITADNWRTVVFGYTCVVDVMARGDAQFGRDFWLAKADTLGPLGPCIVTLDEIADPNQLRVRSWLNEQALQDYAMADPDYRVPQLVEFATTVMTLYSGDVLACGTSLEGLRPLSDGDRLEVEIDGIGRMGVRVAALAGSPV